MQGFFDTTSVSSEPDDLRKNGTAVYWLFCQTLHVGVFSLYIESVGISSDMFHLMLLDKKVKGAKRYVPQKNSVAYALLITLYRFLSFLKNFLVCML